MVLVPLLDLVIIDFDPGTNLAGDHLLGDDLVADTVFEIFKRDALLLSGLLQVFHGFQVHLLPNLVHALDHLGFPGNAKLLALLQQQLLINQIAQHILLPLIPLDFPLAGVAVL